jgi:hypothetical protein
MTNQPAALAQAIARHMAAQAALDAGPEDRPKHLFDEEDEALYDLAMTPCASDEEFSKSCATYTLSKLKYRTCRTMATILAVSPSPPHVTCPVNV